MSAPYARQVQVALFVLITVMFLGGWDISGGSGTWIAPAQAAEDSKDDKDKDDKDRNQGYDHWACYEVKCIDRHDRDGRKVTECDTHEEKVTLFNQFTDDRDKDKDKKEYDDRDKKGYDDGQKVLVGSLKLLCVPTKKVHDDKDDHKDDHK